MVRRRATRGSRRLTVYVYRWNRQGRKGERCIVTARGTMNSCAVQFADGFSMVTSRNALMKDKTMTTTINVGPSCHKVRITTIDKADGNVEGSKDKTSVETLEPGSPVKAVYAHQTRSILIEEVTPADEEKAEDRSPIGSAERVTEDLKNYAAGKPTR